MRLHCSDNMAIKRLFFKLAQTCLSLPFNYNVVSQLSGLFANKIDINMNRTELILFTARIKGVLQS